MVENHEEEHGPRNYTPFSNILLTQANTNFEGPKPGEKTATMFTPEFLNYLMERYGSDAELTAVLENMAKKVGQAKKSQ